MGIIKLLLFFVLIGGVVGGGVYVFRHSLKLPKLPNLPITQLSAVQKLTGSFVGQTRTVLSQAVPTVQQGGQVLGAQIQIKKDGQSLPQRAFEYGRYQYCVQVVKDYESRSSDASSSAVSK